VFTGLVQDVGTVMALRRSDAGAALEVSAALVAGLEPGQSILVNGVCLTASGAGGGNFEADLSPETLRRSSLGELEAGDRVNLELPLRLEDRLGGHIVQGHVDVVAEVREVRRQGQALDLSLEASPHALRYVVEKGSVALDGVSLTVARVDDRSFDVSLIPETLERTNLGDAAPGRKLNLEVDVLAKYVEKLLPSNRGALPVFESPDVT
jgi:riboflavin synthase